MRRVLAYTLCVSFLVAAFGGMTSINAQSPPLNIGKYVQLWSEHELTEQHITQVGEVLHIEGPVFTSHLFVNMDSLAERIGPWASDRAFESDGETAAIPDREAHFSPLDVGPDPAFTWGHSSQILFLERPMWLSAIQPDYGGTLFLEMEDGDTSGQTIFLGAEWLAGFGIVRPMATHENGEELNVTEAIDGTGFYVDVTHFSIVEVNPVGLDVKGRQGGLTFPHLGERRWHPMEWRLEVDVAQQISTYELLVEKEWVSYNIPTLSVEEHEWTIQQVDGKPYYSVVLSPQATPATVVFENLIIVHEFLLTMTDLSASVGTNQTFALPHRPGESLDLILHEIGKPMAIYHGNSTEPDDSVRLLVGATPDGNWTARFVERIDEAIVGGVVNRGTGESAHYVVALTNETLPQGDIKLQASYGCFRQKVPILGYGDCGTYAPPPSNYPYSPPTPPTTRNTMVRAYLENAFVAQFPFPAFLHASDYATSAVWSGADMFETYTGNFMGAVTSTQINNLYTGSSCVTYINIFTDNVPYSDRYAYGPSNPVFALVSGNNNQQLDCNGIARSYGASQLALFPDSVNLGRNRPGYNGGTNSEHLGKVMAQEIGHNWGEPGHPCQYVNGEVSVMCNNASMNNRKFWLHYDDPAKPSGATDSSRRIIDGTACYDDPSCWGWV